ncbi:accessory factor UbiK family protein [Acetobacteraceae bacterium H6797]|nr:accessory factor UbiK family protein [Acetobacteraceae bacterium H6797]
MDRKGKIFDDIAGMAGGAFSALAGLRTEMEAMARAQAEAMITRLDLAKREDLDAAMELARRAREDAEALAERVAALEAKLAAKESAPKESGGESGSGKSKAKAEAKSKSEPESDSEAPHLPPVAGEGSAPSS